MTARAGRTVVFVLAAVALGRPAAAQDPVAAFVGQVVATVRVEIEGVPEARPALLALVDVRPGEPLRVEDVRSTLARLSSLPRFEDVIPRARMTPAGVEVVFDLVPRHPIDRLEFTGDTGIAPVDLERLVRQRYGGLPASTSVDAVVATITRLLADEGYLAAQATGTTVSTHNPERATLVVDVRAGPRSRIARVEVTGRSPYSRNEVIARARVAVGDPYRRRDIQGRIAALEEDLRSRGYYEAAATPSAVPEGGGPDVVLTLLVEAGPRVELRWEGDPRPPGDVRDLVPIERERSADEDLLEDARRRLLAALRLDGYKDASVGVTRESQADGSVVVITFRIRRERRHRVDRVEFAGSLTLPRAVLDEALGVKPGEPFSEARVGAGLDRVLRAYQQEGFYRVDGQPAYEVLPALNRDGEPLVVIHMNIVEGPRGAVAAVRVEFDGGHLVPESDLRAVMISSAGRPYVAADVFRDLQAVEQLYANRGFETARVAITPAASDDGRDVTLVVAVREGPQFLVGDIVVIGNRRVSADTILREITLRPGQPLGAGDRLESQRLLYDLGLFRRVSIIAEPRLPGDVRTNLIISVEESPATTTGFGGGVEVGRRPRTVEGGGLEDRLEVSPRGFFEIGRRNLGGRTRSVNLFSRIALKPRNAPGDPERDGRGFGFSEYRVTGTFRERRAFDTDTDLLLGMTSEQAVRTSFNFIRQTASAEALRRVSRRVSVFGRYTLDFSRLFDERIRPDEQSLIDRLFPQVRLSILSGGVLWNRRDDDLHPTRGTLLSADAEWALRSLGSEVGYAKTFVQMSAFHDLTDTGRAVLAGRVQFGLARGFLRVVPLEDSLGRPIPGPDGQPLTETVADLPASQRFFAGGGTSVRGFQVDRLGVAEILNQNGLSNGGNALLVLNAEVRTVPVRLFGRDLTVVGFTDGGNVFARARDLDLGRLRGTVGFGFRYDSWLGPLRLDVGFKLDRRLIGGRRERGWEYHLSFGEAF